MNLILDGKKQCSNCKELKPFSEFNKKKKGLQPVCKSCSYKKIKDWNKLNPERKKVLCRLNMRKNRKENPRHYKNAELLRTYGITLEEYENLLRNQGGVCAICKSTDNKMGGNRKYFLVDHDHKTGKVRGLLCNPCNTRIGILENSEFIAKAKIYLGLEN